MTEGYDRSGRQAERHPRRVAGGNPVGAKLARDGGVSGDIDVECAGLFAGKPAPTVDPDSHPHLWPTHHPCGSELARDGGASVAGDIGYAGLFAGKPAPTVDPDSHPYLWPTHHPCGSGLAREGGVSGASDMGCTGLFTGRPAPTVMGVVPGFCARHRSLVGAGLLAKAVCQAPVILDVPTSSPASQLPQLIG